MSDITLNRYLVWGTDAERLAFTPNPSDLSGIGPGDFTGVIWVVSDVSGNPAYAWDNTNSDWVPLTNASSSRQLWQYRANTGATSGYPGDGKLLWDNATQTSATNLLFSHLTDDNLDIDLFLAFLATGDTIILQDQTASANFQTWTISGSPTNTNAGMANSYWTVPVTLSTSGGTGTTGFSNNERLIAVVFSAGGSGTVTNTGTLTNHALIVGNGGVDVSALASLGTTTTVLHGNAAGDPTFGAVALATDVSGTLPTANLSTAQQTRQIVFAFDGAGSALTSGKATVPFLVDYACTITKATTTADQSGSCVVSIQSSSYSGFPGSLASIVASAPPTLSSAQKAQDSTLTGWTTPVSAGTVFQASLTSTSTITQVAVVLTVTVA